MYQTTTSDTSTSDTTRPELDDTPFPSRILRLHHPTSRPQTSAPGLQERLDSFFQIDGRALFESAKGGIEKAFWGFLMPSITGIKGIGDLIGK